MDRAWTDARIGDAFQALWERLRALERTNERLATMEAVLPELRRELGALRSQVLEEVGECRTGVRALADAFTQRTEAREKERKDREKERKADRRWLVGTVLAAATLVVGAMAVLVPALTGGP